MNVLGIDNLLMNLLFILVSIFTYHLLGMEKHRYRIWIHGAFCSMSVLFCMMSPFTVIPGFIYDLRIVPFILALSHGGLRSGAAVLGVMLLFRYYLGGEGFYATAISFSAIFLLAIPFLRIISRSTLYQRVLILTGLALGSSLIVTASSLLLFDPTIRREHLPFFFSFCLIVTFGMWVASYIVEVVEENTRMRAEILQSEKMQSLGELAATIAHEIRNPLTVAKGFTQLLKNQTTDERGRGYTEYILNELDRAESIISDYLTYAKPQADQSETIDVRVQLLNIANMMEPYVTSRGHSIRYEMEEYLYIQGDVRKLTQVLVNIIKNAAESMESGGTIALRLTRNGPNAVIDIVDTGIGMSHEQIQRLGKPFYSTKLKGTGLGLMVCYRIIESWGGKIEVLSKKGRGTTFTIKLPLAKYLTINDTNVIKR